MTDMTDRVGGARAPAQNLQGSDARPAGRDIINGQVVVVHRSERHLGPDLGVEGEDPEVKKALRPLRERKVQRATRLGAGAGFTLGVVAFAVLGAVVGSALPGAGTVGGAVVGGLVGSLLFGGTGAVAGAGIGRGIGNWRAGRTTPKSLAQDYAPGTERFAKVARNARGGAGQITAAGWQRMPETLLQILSSRAQQGHPLTPAFVEEALSALIRLERRQELSDREDKQAVHNRLSRALGEWLEQGRRIDAGVVGRAVDALGNARWAARAVRSKRPGGDIGLGAAPGISDDDREQVDATVLERVKRGYAVTYTFAEEAARGFAEIAASDLDGPAKQAATDQFRDILVLCELRPTAQDLIGAEQDLRAADLDHDPRLDQDQRTAIRTFYRAAVSGSLINGDPPEPATRRALLDALVAIQTSKVPPEQRAATLETFEAALDEHLFLDNPVDQRVITGIQKAAVLAEAVLARARLDQERDLHPESIAALEEAYRQIAAARLAVGRPMAEKELVETLEALKAGMRWPRPERDEDVTPLRKQALEMTNALVDTLLDEDAEEADLVKALQATYTASAHFTSARLARGLTYDKQGNLRIDEVDGHDFIDVAEDDEEKDDIYEDLSKHIRSLLDRRALTEEQANNAYERLMGKNGKARALMVAADLLGSTRAMRRAAVPDDHAFARIYGTFGPLAVAIRNLRRVAGKDRPNQDIGELHEVIDALDPVKKSRDFIKWAMRRQGIPARDWDNRFLEFGRQYERDPRYTAAARFDPDHPPLDDAGWKKLQLDRYDATLGRAKEAILHGWPRPRAELTCLRNFAKPHRNAPGVDYHEPHRPLSVAEILRDRAPGPAGPRLGDLPALAGVDEPDSDDDNKDREKAGGSV